MSEKEVGYDCSCCPFFKALPTKALKFDFGFCTNKESKVYYQVLFEHYRCALSKKKWGE